MTAEKTIGAPSDAELVAYLDGELSPAESVRIAQRIAADAELAGRADFLRRGMRPFGEAFDPLLAQAPMDKLEALLASAEAQAAAGASRKNPKRRWLAMTAAAITFAILGGVADRFVAEPLGEALSSAMPSDDSADWRRAVARYLALYTSETLALVPDAGAPRSGDLARVGQRLGLDLTPARVDLAGLSLKRADLYDYDGKPIAFLAYLDARSGPVALCITPGLDRPMPPEVEHRRGMNVVYWVQAHHGFMLIGRAGVDQLRALAGTVADRFGTAGPDPG
jgi:anti-sigma factor RsiW